MRLSVIIPAFNEAGTLPSVVEQLRATLKAEDAEIIVVNDGSTDGTENLDLKGVRFIHHQTNRGHGAAVKTGLKTAEGDTVVIFDADGQHNPRDIARLMAAYDEGNDLVIGARRRLFRQHNGRGNIAISLMASALLGRWVPDLTTGLRLLNRAKTMEFFDYYPDRFCFELTTTFAFALSGYPVKFIGIDPLVRRVGISKIQSIRDGFRFGFLMLRLFWLFKVRRR